MAQFRGYVEGSRNGVSRLGGKSRGLTVEANGWNSGIKVRALHIDGEDVFRIYKTGGSNGPVSPDILVEIVDGRVSKNPAYIKRDYKDFYNKKMIIGDVII